MKDKQYLEQVIEFLSTHGNQLHATRVQSDLASWQFKQRSNKTNQARLLAAQSAYRATASDATAYDQLFKLLQDARFATLNRQVQRALKVAQRTYEENVARPGDDPQFLSLRRELDARVTELEAIKNRSNANELSMQVPAGYDKTFAELVRQLIIDRNRLARMRGFDNFYRMRMDEAEMNYDRMREMVTDLKTALEALKPTLSRIASLGPKRFDINSLCQRITDAPTMLVQTGELMGVSSSTLESILQTSDLYPRRNKDGFWFASQINAPFDVRASVNIHRQPEKLTIEEVKKQLLHEVFGHGVDCRSIHPDLEPLLRLQEPFTAEAVAEISEGLVYEPQWLGKVFGLTPQELRQFQPQLWRLQLDWTVNNLRSNIATVEFEIAMYEDPAQDLDRAYLISRAWQSKKSPEAITIEPGTWAVEVPHYISYPCYCHNYVLGKAWAQQVKQSLRERFGSFVSKRVGPFMAKNRKAGLMYTPDEQILRITGKQFSSAALIGHLQKLASDLESGLEQIPTNQPIAVKQ